MDLYQQLLAAFSGAPTQNQRLLKLHTPLGVDVLLAERVVADEAIGPHALHADDAAPRFSGFRLAVECLCADVHLELKKLLGQPVLLELLTQQSRSDLRPFHGHVSAAELLGSDGGLARYRLTVEPWLATLAHRRDSWVFQGQSVVSIIEEVFADYQGQGQLAPAWRWDLADANVYPQRSLCVQYQESDLDFVERLLREEGLFYWFEHKGDASSDTLGNHTLVIADHNGAFKPNAQPRVRYTQANTALGEDSLTQWHTRAALRTATLAYSSLDYRSLGLRAVSASGANAALGSLAIADTPGLYAYEDAAQGKRLVTRHMQAIDALRSQARARGTLRTAAPASTFTLRDHPVHDGSDTARDQFVTLAVQHRARNNLSADLKARVDDLLAVFSREANAAKANVSETGIANDSEPIYECRLLAQRAAVPVRLAGLDADGQPDPRIHARPTVTGVQTALVVGLGEPVHTDRDHRIKVQFHWQRGGNASHRLDHPGGSNAPASDASGTWVRVAESVSGANWGANFTPRLGQEVLVGFIEGDIDRPVVTGSLYNGQGQANAQANQVSAGAAGATGNAAAWFPGDKPAGARQGHQHPQVLAGHKTQELASSQSGSGGYNQLVFDDTPGANRVELSTTTAQTRLQLGHLLHQNDNQRLQPRGHGLDLATAAWGAVRAGSGMILSAHKKPASTSSARQLDSREPIAQVEQSQELLHTLAETAHKHKAKLASEPDVIGAKKPDAAKQLPVEQALYATQDSLNTTDQRGGAEQEGEQTIGGGHGTITAYGRPDLVTAAPGGIGSFTPAHMVASAGHTASLVAGQDLQQAAQANHATAVKDGVVWFTYGKAGNPQKPNQETGIALHAASGSVNTQSQTAATKITADKRVQFASTSAMVRITAPKHVLLTAAGAALHIEGGNITLKGPGKVDFKASMKELAGGASASASLALARAGELTRFNEAFTVKDMETGQVLRHVRYRIEDAAGNMLAQGLTDEHGQTLRVHTSKSETIKLFILDN